MTPEKFEYWKQYGESIGFRYVASGPLVSVLVDSGVNIHAGIVLVQYSILDVISHNMVLLSVGPVFLSGWRILY